MEKREPYPLIEITAETPFERGVQYGSQAVERIGEANELASRSGAALEEIVATVEATGDQVNAIATASEEQSAASEEINQSIVQVNDMSRQTAEAMAEAAKAVSDLAAQAQGLTNLIRELKEA